MTTTKDRRLKLWSLFSVVLLLISIAIFGVWIYAFQTGANQQERIGSFLSYFPSFLGLAGITAIQGVLATAAIAIGSMSLKQSPNGWKLLNIVVMAAGVLMLLLIIWGLM